MKRIIILSLLVSGAMLSTQTFSQAEFGVHAGITFSDVSVDGLNLGIGLFEPEMIASPMAGVYAEFPLGNGFYVNTELNYTQKGFKVQESMDLDVFGLAIPIGAEVITRFNYLDLPLMLKYKFGQGAVQGYVKAGPSVGYAMSGSVTTRINSIIDIKVAEIDINPQGNLYNDWEIGGVVGAGVEIPTSSGKFFADVSYSHGFTDILNEPVIDLRVRNRAVGVGIGYAFRF